MKTIILIHGLHMHSIHFYFMKKELQKDRKLDVRTFDYHSIFFNDSLFDRLDALVQSIPAENEIVLVGHSLGGLVSRQYLGKFSPQRNIKVITLGTPHQGSLVAKNLSNTILKPLLGNSVNKGLLIKALPKWDKNYSLISIAGTKKIGLTKFFAREMIEDNDGTVFVSETKLDNAGHVVLDDVHHTQLLFSPKAIDEVKKWI